MPARSEHTDNRQIARTVAAQVCVWLVLFGILAYAVTSAHSGTGLGGWLVDWQVQSFGDTSPFLTILALFIVLLVAVSAAFAAVFCIADAVNGAAGSAESPLADRFCERFAFRGNNLALLSIGMAMIVCGAGVGAGVTAYLHWKNEAARGSEFERIHPGAGSAVPRTRYLLLDATVQRRFTYTVNHSGGRGWPRSDYYLLVTAPGWTPHEAVGYVLVLTGKPVKMNLSEITVPLYVEAERGGLPRFLLSFYRKNGITLSDPHYAVSPMPVQDGRVGVRENETTASLIVGLIFVAMGSIFAGVGYALLHRSARAPT